MNTNTLKYLESSENERVRTVAILAQNANVGFKEAEVMLDAMFDECKHPTGVQRQYELAIKAEFNC
ncbi:hypothetical protein [Clostridium magnum]|uniref:Uncharacterized protein n=1 Tax=Clostridium magnum DSM 2767 TaxID=1121326 RepID=A0A161XI14_9CLOT|nr:hypothetical protein [Clostridium magnum]KZL94346.1 hypothetical protein CLMAG_13990 [Clostridium magnum DSM 2767]SHJ52648.1 hypothetical protein SAMN02745944_06111 [Clostridium magnum DSM 2767]